MDGIWIKKFSGRKQVKCWSVPKTRERSLRNHKCGRERTSSRRLYAKPKSQAFHISLRPQRFEFRIRIRYIICDKMHQADDRHWSAPDRTRTVTPYNAEPGPYTEPISILAWSTVSLCWWPPVFLGPTSPCLLRTVSLHHTTRQEKKMHWSNARRLSIMDMYLCNIPDAKWTQPS